MKREEFLQENYGITFTKSGDEFHNEIMKDWLDSMEAYHKHRVNEITDKYQDTEADGLVFCGKCGKLK